MLKFVLTGGLAVVVFGCGGGGDLGQDPSLEVGSHEKQLVANAGTIPAPNAEETIVGTLTPEEMAQKLPFVDGPPAAGPVLSSLVHLRALANIVHERELADPTRAYSVRIDLKTGDVASVAFDRAALSAWAKNVAPDGIAPSSSTVAAAHTAADGSKLKLQSWSGGVDNRVLRNLASQDTTAVLSVTGVLTINSSGGCTGTMFSRQHVFTAAHCVVSSSGGGETLTFAPRQRGATQPYGTSTADGAWVPTAYLTEACYAAPVPSDCQKYDWAIVHFPPTFSPNPGYVGFAALNDADIGAAFNMTVGYPGCSPGAAPAGCVYPNQYQDMSCNNVHAALFNGSTSNAWPYSDGTSPNLDYGCDFSEGDSGSGVFRSSDNALFGNWTNNFPGCYLNCTTYGGTGTRISPDEFQYMLTFRNMAP